MVSQTCRLCLGESHTVRSIFDCGIKTLPEIIMECTVVEILREDNLPKGACTKCIEMVMQFNDFRRQCQHSNKVLKEKFGNTIKPEINGIAESSFDIDTLRGASIGINLRSQKLKSDYEETNSYSITGEAVDNQWSIDDDRLSTRSDSSCDDSKYKPPSEGDFGVDPVRDSVLALSPELKGVRLKKKKCKIKKEMDEEKDSVRPHLVYTEQDYAILGRERKVRIYEMDSTMKEIIGHNVYICEICMQKFEVFFEYYDHQEAHNGELVFNCSKCSEVFSTRQDLVDHDSRHKIPCQICELEVLPKSMSAHLLIHTDVHKCPDCGMRHTSNASLEKHIKARHTGIKGFVCHVCGKQSSCQSSMNRHMAYHSNERPYKCKYCDFCAKSLNIVQVHTSRKHFAEKCVCEICAKLFKSQPSLLQHMKRIHTARKHICDICGKAFIERYNLNRHLKKHAGQRLHECKICRKEFFTIRKLKEHMHSHRQGCVNCPKCGKEFFYKKYYTKHVLKCTTTDNDKIAVNNCGPLLSSFK